MKVLWNKYVIIPLYLNKRIPKKWVDVLYDLTLGRPEVLRRK